MLDPFVGHLRSVKLGEATVETRISVNYLEIIHRDDLDLIVRGDVRKPHILSIPLQLTMQSLAVRRGERPTTPITTISLNGPENWKLDEASVRFSGDSLQARIQSCSWALVDHMSPLPPFTLGIVGLGWLKCSMSETGNKVGFIP